MKCMLPPRACESRHGCFGACHSFNAYPAVSYTPVRASPTRNRWQQSHRLDVGAEGGIRGLRYLTMPRSAQASCICLGACHCFEACVCKTGNCSCLDYDACTPVA